MKKPKSPEDRLIDFVAQDLHDPLNFVRSAYPWGKGDLASSQGPRKWQAEILDTIGKHLRDPHTRHTPLMISTASGHGIGKSALVSQIIHWGMSTMADCKVVVTASTETQLRTKTWPEVTKWFRLGLNAHWFKVTATAVSAIDRGSTWRADAITWSENNTQAFAGLHNEGRRIILIFDEASTIADKVWEVAEGALTDSNTEILWLVFGNPEKNSGRFRECFGRFKHRWITKQIDSRTVEGVNTAFLEKQVAEYGLDNDITRIRILGEFPRAGSMQFIPSDIVEAARKREPEAKLWDPLVMGVDVARFGDDRSVIVLRRGRDARSIPWVTMSGADTMTVAARVMSLADHYRPDAIFIDGGGVGGGVIDRLRQLQRHVIEVQFGASSDRSFMTNETSISYANKRAEMWGSMKDWLRGGMIPDSPDLAADLVGVEFGYVSKQGVDNILLEKKADMKKRGLSSPDLADALALTFAYPVMPSDHSAAFSNKPRHEIDYNPLAPSYVAPASRPSQHQIEYNPLRRT